MEYSKKGFALTESFEGCSLVAYQDIVGVYTIGYGHTRGVKAGDVCTREQAEAWLQQDIADAVQSVNDQVTVPLTQGQFDALVDFVFNLGDKAFEASTLLRLINAGDMEAATNEFEKWSRAGGKVVAGLLRRRQAEKEEFMAPDIDGEISV